MKKVMLGGLVVALLATTGSARAIECGDTAGQGGERVACSCGDTLVTSAKLKRADPLVNEVCTDNGLVVENREGQKQPIVLNCKNRKITGADSSAEAIIVQQGALTVKKCKITGFSRVFRSEYEIVTLVSNRFIDNRSLASFSFGGIIASKNVFRRSGGLDGDEVDGVVKISDNIFEASSIFFYLSGGDDPPVISRNLFRESAGVNLQETYGFVIEHNRFNGGSTAIDSSLSYGLEIRKNLVRDTSGHGIRLDEALEGTEIINNKILRSGGHGLTISGPSEIGVVEGNRSNRNLGSGIHVVDHGALTFSNNRANRNGLDGICVDSADATDGGGNSGRKNGGIDVSFNLGPCADP